MSTPRSKVVQLGPSFKAVSGVTTHLNQLFSSNLAQEFELLHFQVGSEGNNETILTKLWRLLTGPIFLLLFLLRHRPEIVQLNTSLEPKSYWRDLAFLCVSKMLNRRVVYQVHGGALPEEFFANSTLLTALLRRVLAWPDVVVLLAEVELAAYRRFVPAQRLVVIPNAIETGNLVRRTLVEVNSGQLHLAYVGRLAKNKGVFEAIEAFAKLITQGHDLRLTVAGAGPDELHLKELVRKLNLEGRVHFSGPVFEEDKDALWCSVDIFVFPTYHREGLPYALLESMAAGAVPVTTRVGAIPDVLQDGVHGLLVMSKDVDMLAQALARLVGDRTLLLRLAQAGRARVLEQYTVARLAHDFKQLYTNLLGGLACAG